MNTVSKLLSAASENKTLWLPEVRDTLGSDPDSEKIFIRTLCFDGSVREYALSLPAPGNEEETGFAIRYLAAGLFNILAVVGGRKVTVFCSAALSGIAEKVRTAFYENAGLKKEVNIANRLSAALCGCGFLFEICDISAYEPMEKTAPHAGTLAEIMPQAVSAAGNGFYCGIDIGGSDIKLVTVSGGRIETLKEYNWDPSSYPTAEEIIDPIVTLISQASGGRLYDGIGVSFPDIVINDRILGGETPKTKGLRENPDADYEAEFAKIGRLSELLSAYCVPGAPIHAVNDGHIAAVTAAAEMSAAGGSISGGIVAFAIGTDLGLGYLFPDGTVPKAPMEIYDILLDVGSAGARSIPADDIRSVRNENSGMAGMRRYVGQASAFRYAFELEPELLDGFTENVGGKLRLVSDPDMRKPALEHIMQAAEAGDEAAREIFRRIGRGLGAVCREMDFLLGTETGTRYVFGRFVKLPGCFACIREGCSALFPKIQLLAADEDMAETPLMKQLAADRVHTVAQFGQAIGAVYYCLMQERK